MKKMSMKFIQIGDDAIPRRVNNRLGRRPN